MDISIRQATETDLPEITALFRNTIIHINSKHYNEKQIETWASGADETDLWLERIRDFYFIVAENETEIVGFSYLKKGYYLDGLFVHKDHQREGIASALLRTIESQVMVEEYPEIRSDVSKTALPFFENKYYDIIKKQKKNVKGVVFENYIVKKTL
ncbi:acetyltransferase [Formosa agariphila KMM 3901]|uniref:Acetyltransferase n=1 Tax=Formosa agariphila (strain DSM 15362 / KCTC 12365 / LMG 23005 / KMM 3901 / M-2Alg 35-1) TaxID=1347342 RepID=T2KP50_FORAG|nr:GNAT family N-acetyltransferase [Formosa agariphila]CDF80243.1 acetyltransferase [Formosa agariphila KMM 3901]